MTDEEDQQSGDYSVDEKSKQVHLSERGQEKVEELEAAIIEAAVDGEPLEQMYPKLEEVAKLKVEATKVQLNCLKRSMEILNDAQIEYLLPFWDA